MDGSWRGDGSRFDRNWCRGGWFGAGSSDLGRCISFALVDLILALGALVSRISAIKPFRGPPPNPPALTIVQANVFPVQKQEQFVQALLVPICTSASFCLGGGLVELGDREGGGLENVQKLFR